MPSSPEQLRKLVFFLDFGYANEMFYPRKLENQNQNKNMTFAQIL